MYTELYIRTLESIVGDAFNSTQRSRLDYLLVSEVLGLDITSADIMPGYFCDHSLVCIGFKNWYC